MGITFRYSNYHQFVRCGHRTIKDGEAAAVWDSTGVQTEVVGPKRIFLWYSTIRFLDRFKAESHQYLEVKYRDGSIENIHGPACVYLNPCFHDRITTKDAKTLKPNEVLLVYHNADPRDSEVVDGKCALVEGRVVSEDLLNGTPTAIAAGRAKGERVRVVIGPTIYFPHADDILGSFRWSVLPNDLTRYSFSNAPVERTNTIQLHTPTNWRVRVQLGTSSSVKGIVTLGITYQIESIEKATSHADPRASLISALLAEALKLSEGFTDEDFKGDQSGARKKLNEASYAALAETAESCGFVISLIEVLDVVPSDRVRMDMDRDRNSRLEFQSKVASKEQKSRLKELEFEDSKAQLEYKEEIAKQQADVKAKVDQHSFEQRLAALNRANELEQKEMEAKLEAQAWSDAQVLGFLKGLKDLGVDVADVVAPKSNAKPLPAVGDVLGRLSIFVDKPSTDEGAGKE